MVSGRRGHLGRLVTRTVGDIVVVCVTVRRRRMTVVFATVATSAPTTAHNFNAPVSLAYFSFSQFSSAQSVSGCHRRVASSDEIFRYLRNRVAGYFQVMQFNH